MTITDIEYQRQHYKISIDKLCAASGLTTRAYQRILAGTRCGKESTFARLEIGLQMARRGEKTTRLDIIWNLVTAMLAFERDVDVKRLLDHNPQSKATSDPKWCEVQELRDIAVYALHSVAGIQNVEIARVAKVKPAAITYAVQRMENRRDTLLTDKMFEVLERAVAG
jgi:hypothetical protein